MVVLANVILPKSGSLFVFLRRTHLTYISPDDAPIFIFVGEADSTRPVNTRRMVLALRRAGHAPEYAEEEKLDHRITTNKQTIEAMCLFFDQHLKPLR